MSPLVVQVFEFCFMFKMATFLISGRKILSLYIDPRKKLKMQYKSLFIWATFYDLEQVAQISYTFYLHRD